MPKEKSPLNKTLTLSAEEENFFFSQCIDFSSCKEIPPLTVEDIEDKTLCGDSFLALASLPKNFSRLAIVDPPYNIEKNYDGSVFKSMSEAEYEDYTEKYLSLILPALTTDASIYICCDWKSSISISKVLCKFKERKLLKIRNRITWQREKGRGAKENWKNGMEDIWFCTRGNDYVFNLDAVKIRRRVIAPYRENGNPKDWTESKSGKFRDTCPSNFWDDISIPFWSMAENTEHPTQKPEKLIAKLILASSCPGDVILDPFAGSGTSQVTAKKLGRHFVGIEKSRTYCAWAQKRLQDAQSDRKIQGYADGVFWERNSGCSS